MAPCLLDKLYKFHVCSMMLLAMTAILQTRNTNSVHLKDIQVNSTSNLTEGDIIYIDAMSPRATQDPLNSSRLTPATRPPHHNRQPGSAFWTPMDYPDPHKNPILCGRYDPSFVCDPGRNLSERDGSMLDESIWRTCAETWCSCENGCSQMCPGYSIAIAIIPTVRLAPSEVLSAEERDVKGKQWASYLHHQWRFGQCTNDVIIVLSLEDKKLYSSVGEMASHKLTPICDHSVFQDAQEHLTAGRLAQALLQAVHDYRSVFQDNFKCVISFSDVMSTGTVIGIIFGVVCVPLMGCVVLVFLGPCCTGSGFGGSKHKHTFSKYRYHRTEEPCGIMGMDQECPPPHSSYM